MRTFSRTMLPATMILAAWMGGRFAPTGQAEDAQLVGHWKLAENAGDSTPHKNHGQSQHVHFDKSHATFDGRTSLIRIPSSKPLELGAGEFSLALWVHTEKNLDDVLGDLLSKFDPATRRGFNLSIQNYAGVTSAQSNYRQLHFGIDDGKGKPNWIDCGRPGNNMCVFALCVYQGQLFAGTFEHGEQEAGHVYRYAGSGRWTDCGSPARCNAVQSLAVYNGKLYAGAGRYLSKGSSLPESPNEIPGGQIFRYEGDGKWIDCGKLKNSETGESFTVGGMVVYRGELYAGVSKHPGRGLYRYDGKRSWQYLGNPGHRVTNPVVYNGKMYFCSLDGGGISRYDGNSTFSSVGKPADVTQTYGFAIHQGQLYTSSWPNGEVFRFDGKQSWIRSGRLGNEKEVMGMAVYNGKLYAGTLPLAQVYRYEGGTKWQNTGQLDKTPDVRYRRAWSMAVFQGKLFCGTLPSGHVYSLEVGQNVTYDHALPAGWVHLVAQRTADHLCLYVDGKLVAKSENHRSGKLDISNNQPLVIGQGGHDHFLGKLKDVRLYRGRLTGRQITALANKP